MAHCAHLHHFCVCTRLVWCAARGLLGSITIGWRTVRTCIIFVCVRTCIIFVCVRALCGVQHGGCWAASPSDGALCAPASFLCVCACIIFLCVRTCIIFVCVRALCGVQHGGCWVASPSDGALCAPASFLCVRTCIIFVCVRALCGVQHGGCWVASPSDGALYAPASFLCVCAPCVVCSTGAVGQHHHRMAHCTRLHHFCVCTRLVWCAARGLLGSIAIGWRTVRACIIFVCVRASL